VPESQLPAEAVLPTAAFSVPFITDGGMEANLLSRPATQKDARGVPAEI
jgi:hypothetical protein